MKPGLRELKLVMPSVVDGAAEARDNLPTNSKTSMNLKNPFRYKYGGVSRNRNANTLTGGRGSGSNRGAATRVAELRDGIIPAEGKDVKTPDQDQYIVAMLHCMFAHHHLPLAMNIKEYRGIRAKHHYEVRPRCFDPA